MPYGLIACFTTKPGHRDAVVAQLTTASRELSALGCRQYIVGAARADDVTVSLSGSARNGSQSNTMTTPGDTTRRDCRSLKHCRGRPESLLTTR